MAAKKPNPFAKKGEKDKKKEVDEKAPKGFPKKKGKKAKPKMPWGKY
jgi:hypothetical protein